MNINIVSDARGARTAHRNAVGTKPPGTTKQNNTKFSAKKTRRTVSAYRELRELSVHQTTKTFIKSPVQWMKS